MPRFVILHHRFSNDHPRATHWDLMLEHRQKLLTWAMDQPPTDAPSQLATRLPDHRSIYLEYEGPVSDDRGWVERWDAGEFEWLSPEEPDLDLSLERGNLLLRLSGQRIEGRLELTLEPAAEKNMDSDAQSAAAQRWRLCLFDESATRD